MDTISGYTCLLLQHSSDVTFLFSKVWDGTVEDFNNNFVYKNQSVEHKLQLYKLFSAVFTVCKSGKADGFQ